MSHVFISYAEDDASFTRKLVKNLRTLGFPVWTEGGRDREHGLVGSSAVVVIMSNAARQSIRVQHEIALAVRYNLSIFPLLLDSDASFPELGHLQFHRVFDGAMPSVKFYTALWNVVPYDATHLEKAETDLTDRLITALVRLKGSGEVCVINADDDIRASVRPLEGDRVRAEFTFPWIMTRDYSTKGISRRDIRKMELRWRLLERGAYRDAPLLFVECPLRDSIDAETLAYDIADIYRLVFSSSLTNLTIV